MKHLNQRDFHRLFLSAFYTHNKVLQFIFGRACRVQKFNKVAAYRRSDIGNQYNYYISHPKEILAKGR